MSLYSVCFSIASFLMLFAAYKDWRCYRVPYVSIIGVALTGILAREFSIILPLVVGLGLFVVAWLMQKIKGRPVLGYGDVQLFMASVVWMNVEQIPFFFMATGSIGILLAILFKKQKYFPLVPAIAAAWFLSFL